MTNPIAQSAIEIPSAGRIYVDPAFGATILRVTEAAKTPDAATDGKAMLKWIAPEYSTACPFNCTNTLLLLVAVSYMRLYSGGGRYLRDLPFEINASSEPRWSRNDPDILYFVSGNKLKAYNAVSGRIELVREFGEYAAISGKGESDISEDGDHFVFCGDEREVFVYQISKNHKYDTLTTGAGFNNVHITPDNHVLVTWNETGVEMFTTDMQLIRHVARAAGHMDVCRDTNGDECLVWTNSGDPRPIACQNGIVKIRLASGEQTCLLPLDWNLGVHISVSDEGSIFVSTELNPKVSPDWGPYAGEILQIAFDGSVKRIAHHRSTFRDINGDKYTWQPKVTCSRDGKILLWGSNFGGETVDTYMTVPSVPRHPERLPRHETHTRTREHSHRGEG